MLVLAAVLAIAPSTALATGIPAGAPPAATTDADAHSSAPPSGDLPPHVPATPEPISRPSRADGSTVARIVAPSFARARVRSQRRGWRIGTQTVWSGQPQTLLVLDSTAYQRRQWLKVLLPVRPNGSTGWVPRDRVALARSRYWIDVRTSARTVIVYRDGKRVRHFGAVVGAPATPTPTGLAATYERNRQPEPDGFLGPWAMPLTILSNVLENYGGGPGRVGIHGRGGASLQDPIGSARSHGCIRVDNDDVAWLATRIPAGTPVRIRD